MQFFIVNYKHIKEGSMIQQSSLGKNIQSVQRAIDILECFNENRTQLALSEISTMLNLNKSTVHGIINTLYNNGYIQQDEDRKYLLGPAILAKANYQQKTLRSLIISIAKPYMQEVSNKYQATINLFIVADERPVFSHQVIPQIAKYTLTHVSGNSPLYSTATGKLTLSQISSERFNEYLNNINLEQLSIYTIRTKEELLKNIDEIKAQGYSYENEELLEGVSAISVPIYNKSGAWIGAMSVVDIAFHISKVRLALVNDLKVISKQITEKINLK